jgi:hypothetical protein
MLKVDTWSTLIVRKSQLGNQASEGQSSYSNTFPILNKHEPSIKSRPVKRATRWGLYVPPTLRYLYRFTVLLLFYCLIQTRNHGRSILRFSTVENLQLNNEEGMLHYKQQSKMPSWISDLARNVFWVWQPDQDGKLESIQPAPDIVVT